MKLINRNRIAEIRSRAIAQRPDYILSGANGQYEVSHRADALRSYATIRAATPPTPRGYPRRKPKKKATGGTWKIGDTRKPFWATVRPAALA